jgi:urea transport system permease protein
MTERLPDGAAPTAPAETRVTAATATTAITAATTPPIAPTTPSTSRWARLPGLILVILSLALLFAPPSLFPVGESQSNKFWLGLFAKYLTLTLLALSVDLVWGYCGLLSLGQGLYFGLGAYMVAYSLTLQEAAKSQHLPIGTAVPQFAAYTGLAPNDPNYVAPKIMEWITPLGDLRVAVLTALALSTLVSLLFGLYTFRPSVRHPKTLAILLGAFLVCLGGMTYFWRAPLAAHPVVAIVVFTLLPCLFLLGLVIGGARIGGVYFALVTQALLLAVFILVRNQQRYTGGVVGIKDLADFKLFDKTFDLSVKGINSLVYLVAGSVTVCFLLCTWLVNSKFGKVLTALRDSETRVRALGYNTGLYKTFAFMCAGALAGLGGALYLAANELCGPGYLAVEFSIEAVIWVAVGGRGSLLGAVAGTLLLGFTQSYVGSAFPEYWTIILGALFVLVVLFLRNGIYGAAGNGTLLVVLIGLFLSQYVERQYGRSLSDWQKLLAKSGCLFALVLVPMASSALWRRLYHPRPAAGALAGAL